MYGLHIEHRVDDFDAWKAAFDGDPIGRRAGGVRAYRVARTEAPGGGTAIAIDLEFDDLASAEAFHERLRQLWSGAGIQALGIGSPEVRVEEIVDRG